MLNPTVIVEVLSRSTEAYDRGEKFRRYRQIESLRSYLLASSDSMALDLFTRGADGAWVLTSANKPDELLAIDSIGCTLSIADVYDKVEFEQPPSRP